jgi:hypothetical protein
VHIKSMANTTEIPKPSDKEAKQLLEVASHAYDNKAADSLFDEAMEAARHYEQFFSGEESRTE